MFDNLNAQRCKGTKKMQKKMQIPLFKIAWIVATILVLIGFLANPFVSFAAFDVETPSCTPYGIDWWSGKCSCTKHNFIGLCSQAVYKPVTAMPAPAPTPQAVPTGGQTYVAPSTGPTNGVPPTGQTYIAPPAASSSAVAPAPGLLGEVLGGSCTTAFASSSNGTLVCSKDCGMRWRSATVTGCPAGVQPTSSVPTGPAWSPTAAPKTPQPVTYSINGGTVVLFGVDPYAKFQIGAAVAAVPDPVISDAAGALIVGVAIYEIYLAGETGILLNDLAMSLPQSAIPSVPTAQALTGGGNMPPKCVEAWFMLSQNQAFEKIPNGVKLLSDWQHFNVTTPNGASVKWGNLINTLLSPECAPYFNVETVKNLGDEFFKITMK